MENLTAEEKGKWFCGAWVSIHIPRARRAYHRCATIIVKPSRTLWGPPGYARLSVHSNFSFVGKRLQALERSMSSKGQIQTITN